METFPGSHQGKKRSRKQPARRARCQHYLLSRSQCHLTDWVSEEDGLVPGPQQGAALRASFLGRSLCFPANRWTPVITRTRYCVAMTLGELPAVLFCAVGTITLPFPGWL